MHVLIMLHNNGNVDKKFLPFTLDMSQENLLRNVSYEQTDEHLEF